MPLLAHNVTSAENAPHPAREVLQHLTQRGASFFNDLVRGTGRLPSEVEDGLWELVAAPSREKITGRIEAVLRMIEEERQVV